MTTSTPQRLKLEDLPRDKNRALGGLRSALVASFNYCRKYPVKLALMKTTLKFTYNKIVEYEKAVEVKAEAKARQSILDKAKAAGIDLDERLTTEKLEADLCLKLEEQEAAQAAEAAESAVTTLEKE